MSCAPVRVYRNALHTKQPIEYFVQHCIALQVKRTGVQQYARIIASMRLVFCNSYTVVLLIDPFTLMAKHTKPVSGNASPTHACGAVNRQKQAAEEPANGFQRDT